MAAPIVMSDEELYQLTGSWEAAAALRDEQNNALNQYNWSQAATPAATPATPATPAVQEATPTYTAPADTPTFTDLISAPPTSQDDFLSTISTPAAPTPVEVPVASSVAAPVTPAKPSDADIVKFLTDNPTVSDTDIATIMRDTGLTPADIARATVSDVDKITSRYNAALPQATTPVTPPADNITSTGGYTKSATRPTSGGVSNVIEGDDIDTQIAQLPEEYASWGGSTPGYTELIRKSDGAVLDRRKLSTLTDADLIKMGLSFIPGMAPFVQGLNALNAAKTGNVLDLVSSIAGLSGATDVANVANLVKNPLSLVSAGLDASGMSDLSGINLNNIGGVDTQDISKLVNTIKAVKSGDVAGILNSAVGYLQPSDTGVTTPTSTDTDVRNLATKDLSSTITAPTDTQSLLDILGDNSSKIISDAPFVAAPETPVAAQRTPPDYSKRSFNSAFAAARLSGEPDFTWKGQTFTTELAPSLNAGPISGRTINTRAGLDANALANWGGSKVDVNALKAAAPYLGWDPSTYFPKVDVRMAAPTGALGNVPETGYAKNQQTYLNLAPFINKSEAVFPGTTADVLSHELAHVGQVLSSKPGEDVSKLFLRMADQAGLSTTDVFNRKSDITKFNQDLNKAIPYISETYGNNAGSYLGNPKAPLFEKLTDLAAIEMQTGKDLTKDPVLKETLFKDPKIVAMYNTLTIPRMSRLDPRDLPTGTVTTSDFPKGEVPLGMRFRNMMPARSKGWATPYAAGGLAGGGLTEDKAKALADAYAAGDLSTVNQLLSSGISAEDVKSYFGFTDADIAGLSGSGISFSQPADTTTKDLVDTVSPPADIISPPTDNITATGGVTKSAVAPTSGTVIEGDDIETQIAQLPEEYATWSRSADGRFMNFIRKDDGAILKQTPYTPGMSNLDLLKLGLSFVPGAGQVLAAVNIADAARTGDLTKAAIGATGLIPGLSNVNTALKVGQAIDQDNILGAVTALAGNSDVVKLTGLDSANVGGFTAKDITAAGNLIKAAGEGNVGAAITNLGTLTGSSDTTLAGRALTLITRLENGDTRALSDAVNLSNSISGNKATTTGTKVSDAGDDVTLPGGVTLASTGDGVFRTDVGGVPTYAESSNAATVKAPLGYTLLSMAESDDKPAGAYYDITANAWFKPDTAVTDLTGGTTITSDADLFNTSIGDLDKLDATRTGDDYADFLASIGITNTTQLADSGLSNQDILDLINATSGDTSDGTKGDKVTDKGTVVVTGGRESCPIGTVLNPDTGDCDPIVDDKGTVTVTAKRDTCPVGTVLNPETGDCDPIVETPIQCEEGFHLGPDGKTCVADEEDDTTVVTPPVVTPPVVKPPVVTPPVVKPPVVVPPVVTPPVVTPPVVTPPKKVVRPSYVPSTGVYVGEDRSDPFYASGMDDFDLFATLQELLADDSDKKDKKKDNKKSKDKTKMATGGHLDDLLAEQMTVDDLLKLLR